MCFVCFIYYEELKCMAYLNLLQYYTLKLNNTSGSFLLLLQVSGFFNHYLYIYVSPTLEKNVHQNVIKVLKQNLVQLIYNSPFASVQLTYFTCNLALKCPNL